MLGRCIFSVVLLWQVGALLGQFVGGFVPFVRPPQRLAGSWDMFSVPIERCDICWDPPVPLGGRPRRCFTELAAPLEWEVIFDRVASYREFAIAAVPALRPQPTQVHLHCVLPDATSCDEDFDVR